MDEIRLAFRRLTKQPGATMASMLALGCGIGSAAVAWSLLAAVLLYPLPVRDARTLAILASSDKFAPGTQNIGFVYPYYPHIRDSGTLESVTAAWLPPLLLPVVDRGTLTQAQIAFVAGNFFDVLGIGVPVGRSFSAEDDRRGAAVAILSDRYWKTAFNGDRSVIGRTIAVAAKPITIVGVAQRRFRGLNLAQAPAMYLPLQTIGDIGPPTTNYFADPAMTTSPTSGVSIIGRLSSGQTATQVTGRLAALPRFYSTYSRSTHSRWDSSLAACSCWVSR
jgi:macrolide transport system ATP-binding/permease protein